MNSETRKCSKTSRTLTQTPKPLKHKKKNENSPLTTLHPAQAQHSSTKLSLVADFNILKSVKCTHAAKLFTIHPPHDNLNQNPAPWNPKLTLNPKPSTPKLSLKPKLKPYTPKLSPNPKLQTLNPKPLKQLSLNPKGVP